jgi:hypothetical protein
MITADAVTTLWKLAVMFLTVSSPEASTVALTSDEADTHTADGPTIIDYGCRMARSWDST